MRGAVGARGAPPALRSHFSMAATNRAAIDARARSADWSAREASKRHQRARGTRASAARSRSRRRRGDVQAR